MNDLRVFNNTEFGELGVMIIDGKEYFPATRCAKILGYKEPEKAIREKCKGVSKMDTPTTGGIQKVNYIPEGDLYRLIVSSKLPGAEKFERWVFDEVLPSIRRTGSYGANSIDTEQLVSKVTAAVISEVLKQVLPVINSAVTAPVERTVGEKRIAKKYTYVTPSKIEQLPPEVKEQADDMIASGKYSCQQVANFVQSITGEYISQMSVNRYKRRHFVVTDVQLTFFEEGK